MKTKPPTTDVQVAELEAAVAAFEASLPTKVGIAGRWPELTDVRRDRLHQVQRLLKVVDKPRRPRRECIGCIGNGWFLIDPDDNPDWQPCRRCLTTGMELRPMRQKVYSSVHE